MGLNFNSEVLKVKNVRGAQNYPIWLVMRSSEQYVFALAHLEGPHLAFAGHKSFVCYERVELVAWVVWISFNIIDTIVIQNISCVIPLWHWAEWIKNLKVTGSLPSCHTCYGWLWNLGTLTIGTYCIFFRLEVTAVWTKSAGIKQNPLYNAWFCWMPIWGTTSLNGHKGA